MRRALAVIGFLILGACDGPSENTSDAGTPDVKQCVDQCTSNAQCGIGGSPAICVNFRCEEPPINGSPACVTDDDCAFLLATFFGTPCVSRADCETPEYSGPCVDGHSAGALCGLPYFGICDKVITARSRGTESEVFLCGTNDGPTHCVDGICTGRPPTCSSDEDCEGYGTCADGQCACSEASDCAGPPARFFTELVCD